MKRSSSGPIRGAMKLLCAMLGLILAVMLGTTLYFYSDLTGETLSPAEMLTDIVQDTTSLLTSADRPLGSLGTGVTNILLVGQDRRENEDRARSDTMILCTFHKESKTITMTSILRDLYVPIPGHGSNRINAAYTFGGMELLEQTLEENLDLRIEGCVEVDFSQFSTIIDRLGGVSIELRQDEAELINRETKSSLTQGVQTLNGKQALSYSRIRKLDSDGDFSRTNRQRKVLTAILDTYKNADLPTMLTLLDDLLPMITTDLGAGKMAALAMQILPALSGAELRSQHIPEAGSYENRSIDGMSVLTADMDQLRENLRKSLAAG